MKIESTQKYMNQPHGMNITNSLMKVNPTKLYWFSLLIITLIAFFVFFNIVYFHIQRDIRDHARFVENIQTQGVIPAHPLYFLFIYVLSFSFFFINFQWILIVSIIVLSASVAFKFVLTRKILCQTLGGGLHSGDNIPTVLAFSMVFITSLPFGSPYFLLGQFSPNIWHNSTTIFGLPFNIILFYYSYLYLSEEPTSRNLATTCMTCIVSILIKPNFFIPFAFVFPFFTFLKYRWTKPFYNSLILISACGLVMLLQYYIIYVTEQGQTMYLYRQTSDPAGIVFAPFEVWKHYSNHISVSLVASIPLPIFYVLFYRDVVVRDSLFWYASALFTIGLVIYVCLKETGYREFHNNFIWQLIVSNYLLHLSVVRSVYFQLSHGLFKKRDILFFALLGITLCSGFTYLARILFIRNAL